MGKRVIDEQRSAEIVAKRHNNAAARKLPLFAAAGILDQVVPPVTAEQVLAKRAKCRANIGRFEAEGYARQRRNLACYQAAYAESGGDVTEALERCAKACVPYALRFNPHPPETFDLTSSDLLYQADWWNRELARYLGLTSLEVGERFKTTPIAEYEPVLAWADRAAGNGPAETTSADSAM